MPQHDSVQRFFERLDKLRADLAALEFAIAETAKESRLRELNLALERMLFQQRYARGDYYCVEGAPPTSETVEAATNFVAFPGAMKTLAGRLQATAEELAMWVHFGPECGGIAAYRKTNDQNTHARMQFDPLVAEDPITQLMASWFRQGDVERFKPRSRYMSGAMLINRWRHSLGPHCEAFIRAKIAESSLLSLSPIFGAARTHLTDGSEFPLLADSMFELSYIARIEVQGGIDLAMAESDSADVGIPPDLDPCAHFRALIDLHPAEVSITFVGDTSELGATGNGMLEIRARGETRRVSLAEFGLVDRKTGNLNKQAAVLIGLANGQKILRTDEKISTTIGRLRKAMRDRLGFKADPFTPYNWSTGWKPLFALFDARGRADLRAKQDAQRRMASLDQMRERGYDPPASEEEHVVGEDDSADDWLKGNDPLRRA